MEKSNLYFERAKRLSPGGVHSPVRAFKSVGGNPIFFESAEGAKLKSVDGKVYTDFCMSFGPLLLGHRDPDVSIEVHKMVDRAWTFGACEPYSLALAEFIKECVPFIDKIRFVSSGTEAVMSALRVARAATKRTKILKFDGCYHGHLDSLLVKSGSGLAGESSSDSAGVSNAVAAETLVCDLDNSEQLNEIFKVHGPDIAAVAIEPLPANYGLLIQRKEFLKEIETLCHKYGSLLIFDEVITGFRVGIGGMALELGIKPDLVCYGKVLGGGFNVAAYAGRHDLMDLVAPSGPVYQAGTLSANPIGMVAGLTTLKKAIQENVYKKLETSGAWLQGYLNSELEKINNPLRMVRFGSLFWLHTSDKTIRKISDIPTDHKTKYGIFFHQLINDGIYLAPSGFEVGFLSLAHNQDILKNAADSMVNAAKKAF